MVTRWITLIIVAVATPCLQAQDGFAADVTGGEGGQTYTARTPQEFIKYISGDSTDKRIVYVEGTLHFGKATVSSNRTIIGRGGATIVGNLYIRSGIKNVIIRNIHFTNTVSGGEAGDDGLTILGGKRVWIDHCTFFECPDGFIDMVEGADLITVSWCKFYYTSQLNHRLAMLIIGQEKNDKGKKTPVRVTLHHNWFAERCDQRMPAARLARVHLYNNYFSCSGNSYCTEAREEAEVLAQNNFYDRVKSPLQEKNGGRIRSEGNIFRECSGRQSESQAEVFTPPYRFSLEPAENLPDLIRSGAGIQSP